MAMKQTKIIKISNKLIGPNQPVFIIAEAGVNHNGRVDLAKKLILEAKKTGADAIKFQTFKAEEVTLASSPAAGYQKKNTGIDNQLKLLKSLELNDKNHLILKRLASKNKIIFISTPHGHIASSQRLTKLGVPAFKVGSGDITNLPFLEDLGKRGKPIILSTGMATIKEIKEAVRTIEKIGNKQIIILQATTEYPCLPQNTNISAILDLKKHFPEYPIGFSDHTQGFEADILAVGFGARVIEKHFTLDKNLPGPDHKASLNPEEFSAMVKSIRTAEMMIGSGKKIPCNEELEFAPIVRKSIVTITNIKKGQKITDKMISVKRPAKGGLSPKYWHKIIGKISAKNIQINKQLKIGDWK